jgi:hypothetical protein
MGNCRHIRGMLHYYATLLFPINYKSKSNSISMSQRS